MAGNFTTILWDKLFRDFETQLGLAAQTAYPFMRKIFLNLEEPDTPPLTGPLARKDLETIHRNLKALENDPFKNVYEGFLEAFGLDEIIIGDRK